MSRFFEWSTLFMHTTLYRKWRPADFSSVCGQDHITSVLRYEIQNGKTTHAYLFCGSRGTGKTSCAKIFAKAVNCENPSDGNPCGKCSSCIAIESGNVTDIIEMDAASNNGVDYIRDIRDEVIYSPALLKKKVYIIDEVHMLSSSAFNALLKTLEEPPEHVIFILATTELQKLPSTVISRCQRFDFKRISADDIASRLEYISMKENIPVTHEAAKLIGKLSQGAMRDSISLLELCSGYGKTVDTELVNSVAGITGRKAVSEIVRAVIKRDCNTILSAVNGFVISSKDLTVFWQELIDYYRDMLIIRSVKNARSFADMSEDEYSETADLASMMTKERMLFHINLLEKAFITMQRASSIRRACAEVTLIRMSEARLDDSSDALLSRIASLEEKISSADFTVNKADNAEHADLGIGMQNSRTSESKDDSVSCDKTGSDTASTAGDNGSSEGYVPLPHWADIVNKVESSDKGAGSVLKLAKGFISGNNVKIQVSDSFSEMLLGSDEIKSKIASAINMCCEIHTVRPENIYLCTIKKDNDRSDDILSSLGTT